MELLRVFSIKLAFIKLDRNNFDSIIKARKYFANGIKKLAAWRSFMSPVPDQVRDLLSKQ